MRTGIIILARANFGRWPDKILYEILGKSIFEWTLRKCMCMKVDEVIVSTTDRGEDDIIIQIAMRYGAKISLGDPYDGVARHVKAIKDYDLDIWLPVTPAIPLFDADASQELIDIAVENPGYHSYTLGLFTTHSFVPAPYSRFAAIDAFEAKDYDPEMMAGVEEEAGFVLERGDGLTKLRNKYLFNANIAYKIEADAQRRLCESYGHFPKNYTEVVEALMEYEP